MPTAVALSGGDTHVAYVASGDDVFRAATSGTRWQRLAPVGGDGAAWSVWPAPAKSSVLVVVGGGGPDAGGQLPYVLLRSDDGGRSWTRQLRLADVSGVAVASADARTVYVAAQLVGTPADAGDVLLRSTDGGASWTRRGRAPRVTDGSVERPLGPGRLVVDPRHPEVIYEQLDYGMARSRDGGRSFQRLRIP